ncbi:hypothetical protein Pst134EB_006576 [Puccinia striiformis f. sp. tritici]|nr:hypothetical protein Pst134EB_006576 [Puccinia striiformis f. sp. tritici]
MFNFRPNGFLLGLLWVMAITIEFALGASVSQSGSGKGKYQALVAWGHPYIGRGCERKY